MYVLLLIYFDMDSNDTFDTSKDNPFNFREDLSLQLLASTKLALRLWRDKIYNNTAIWDGTWFASITEFCCKEFLVVPSKIAYLVDNGIKLIHYEVRIWLQHFMPAILSIGLVHELSHEKLSEMFLELFDNIVFKPDITICLKSTAVYLLTKMELKPEIKYKLACEYCLEGYVRQIWTSVQNDTNAPGQSSLVLYWNNVMTFWGNLTEGEQITRAIEILQNADIAIMKTLLPMLNETQVEIVCGRVGDCIFAKLMEIDDNFEHAMKSWICMKDFIPGSIFYSIIPRLWEIVFNHAELDFFGLNRSNSVVLELWASAPDRLKSSTLGRHQIIKLFQTLVLNVRGFDNYDLEFLFELLKNVRYQLRNYVWIHCWRELIVRAKPAKLEKIMKLCLTTEEEIELFKEQKMSNFKEVKDYCSSCIKNGRYAELCEYLNFCEKNPKRLESLRKEIILCNIHSVLLCDDNEFAKFNLFIYQTFHDVDAAYKFKEDLILAPEYLGFVYGKLDDNSFNEIMNMSSRFPSSQKKIE
ncbi:hypothetical protein U1Q18_048572 [Sarracenia purpurea var. burkii]